MKISIPSLPTLSNTRTPTETNDTEIEDESSKEDQDKDKVTNAEDGKKGLKPNVMLTKSTCTEPLIVLL